MRSFFKTSLNQDFIKTLPKFNMERTLVGIHAMVSLNYAHRLDILKGGYEIKGLSPQEFKRIQKTGRNTSLKWLLPVMERLLDFSRKEYGVEISSKDFWAVFWRNRGSKPKEAYQILEFTNRLDLALEMFDYVNPKFVINNFPDKNAYELMKSISQEFFFVEEKGFILHSKKYTYGNGDVPLYIIKEMKPKKLVGTHYKALWWIRDMGRIDYPDFCSVFSFIKKGSSFLEILSKTNMSAEEASRKDLLSIKNYYGVNLDFSLESLEKYWPRLTRPHKKFLVSYYLSNKKNIPLYLCKKILQDNIDIPSSDLRQIIKDYSKPVGVGYLTKALIHVDKESAQSLMINLNLNHFPESLFPEIFRACLIQKRDLQNKGFSTLRGQGIKNDALLALDKKMEEIHKKVFHKTKGKDRLTLIFKPG